MSFTDANKAAVQTIAKVTTAGDILNQLGLKDYLLSKGPNDPFLAAAESVYDKVNDGEKIFASTMGMF